MDGLWNVSIELSKRKIRDEESSILKLRIYGWIDRGKDIYCV